MPTILAIETSTEACSVALLTPEGVRERSAHEPRRHQELIFPLLNEVVDASELNAQNIDALAFGHGPGSFTGLRIAASAIQGLSYGTGIGAIGVSTLAAQALRALRENRVTEVDRVLSLIDARVGEVYAALYRFADGLPELEAGPWSCSPGELGSRLEKSVSIATPGDQAGQSAGSSPARLHAVGDGVRLLDDAEPSLSALIVAQWPETSPMARDVAVLAAAQWQSGGALSALEAQPVYVRDEISWKKLAEQGVNA